MGCVFPCKIFMFLSSLSVLERAVWRQMGFSLWQWGVLYDETAAPPRKKQQRYFTHHDQRAARTVLSACLKQGSGLMYSQLCTYCCLVRHHTMYLLHIRVHVNHLKPRPGANIHCNGSRPCYSYVRSVCGTTSYSFIVLITGLKLVSQAHRVSSTKPFGVFCVWFYISYKRSAGLDSNL